MGVAYYISVDGSVDGFDVSMDGKFLGRNVEVLNKFCGIHQIPKLVDFYSQDPSAILEILPDGDRELMESQGGTSLLSSEEWFSADEGLHVVRMLIKCVVDDSSVVENPGELLEDLRRLVNDRGQCS